MPATLRARVRADEALWWPVHTLTLRLLCRVSATVGPTVVVDVRRHPDFTPFLSPPSESDTVHHSVADLEQGVADVWGAPMGGAAARAAVAGVSGGARPRPDPSYGAPGVSADL